MNNMSEQKRLALTASQMAELPSKPTKPEKAIKKLFPNYKKVKKEQHDLLIYWHSLNLSSQKATNQAASAN